MSSASANGNAVGYFVDRHVREGRDDAMAFHDPWRSLSYRALAEATGRFAGALGAAGVARERRVALLLLDTIDFRSRVLGCDPRRRRAGADQHAAHA